MLRSFSIRIAFSLMVFLLTLEVLLRLIALFNIQTQQIDQDSYRILALGESTTARSFKSDNNKNWPEYLEELAKQQNLNIRVYNEGVHATTTPRILEMVPQLIEHYRPHLIISMMGINDAPTFWPKEFVLQDQSIFFRSRAIKLIYFLYQKFKKPNVNLEEISEKNKIIPSRLGLNVQPIIVSILKSSHSSTNYNNLIIELKRLVENRTALDQAKFFSYVAYTIKNHTKNKDDIKKTADLFFWAAEKNANLSKSGNLALDYNIRAGFYDRCKTIAEYSKRDHIYMNDTFLKHVAICIGPTDPSYVTELFKFAGDRYTFRPEQNDRPTEVNYLKLKKIALDNNICLLALQYPNIKLSDFLKNLTKQNESKIFTLEQFEVFQQLLQTKKFDEVFVDNFATDFGHTTDLGSTTIAKHVLKFLLSDDFNKEACNWIKK